MKHSTAFFLLLLTSFSVVAQKNIQNNSYQLFTNLNNVNNDKLTIELITPATQSKKLVYKLPAIVPGTYAIYDFGRYVSNFTALSKKGKKLAVQHPNANTWEIDNANELEKIAYEIDDTWDSPEIKGAKIFEPAGSNIEHNKAFMLNTFCFAGYFDGMEQLPYQLNFTKPKGFYGATSLIAKSYTETTEQYEVNGYHALADAPIMFSKPDTTVLKIGGADILIAVYSPNAKVNSKEIAGSLQPLLEAQKEYLGGTLPVQKYAFVIALTDNRNISSYGALEHSYSSFYFLPEWLPTEQLTSSVKDASSHEFFHILTPLSIHSKEIGNFDFANPTMSKHLWLYEGMTEYEAQHMQVKYGLNSLDEFLNRISDKISNAQFNYNDSLPFTVMSKGVLDTYKEQYPNVYEKGAIINLCLDILLRDLSNGKYGTQQLMQDLSKKYGKNNSFDDDALFDAIAQLTYPEVKTFILKYIDGPNKLPLKDIFEKVGIHYDAVLVDKGFKIGVRYGFNDKTQRLIVSDASELTAFGQALGIKEGDEIVAINGTVLTVENLQNAFLDVQKNIKEGDAFTLTVMRKTNDNQTKELQLSAKVFFVTTEKRNQLTLIEQPTERQKAIFKAWLQP